MTDSDHQDAPSKLLRNVFSDSASVQRMQPLSKLFSGFKSSSDFVDNKQTFSQTVTTVQESSEFDYKVSASFVLEFRKCIHSIEQYFFQDSGDIVDNKQTENQRRTLQWSAFCDALSRDSDWIHYTFYQPIPERFWICNLKNYLVESTTIINLRAILQFVVGK